MIRLGVNVDHVATLRQARGGKIPSPVWAALEAQRAGCERIVCHLREDRRHIQDQDLWELKRVLRRPLNLEMAADLEIVRIACRVRPAQATLVPERRQELTTEGGLDLRKGGARLEQVVRRLQEAGIRVSLFIDPNPIHVDRAAQLRVSIVEFHTGRYAQAFGRSKTSFPLSQLRKAAVLAQTLGLEVAAGHGLDYRNVGRVAAIPQVEEVNIGFSIVARALEIGFYRAVQEMVRRVRRRGA